MTVERAKRDDANSIALLHKELISTGFISMLRISLLSEIYRYIIDNEYVMVLKDKKGELIGFITFSQEPERMYRKFFFRRIFKILLSIPPLLLKKGFLNRILVFLKTLTKNKEKTETYLNMPELLSIAISNKYQNSGYAGLLLNELENYLKRKSISSYKVIAGKNLEKANRFYLSKGFKLKNNNSADSKSRSNIYFKNL